MDINIELLDTFIQFNKIIKIKCGKKEKIKENIVNRQKAHRASVSSYNTRFDNNVWSEIEQMKNKNKTKKKDEIFWQPVFEAGANLISSV